MAQTWASTGNLLPGCFINAALWYIYLQQEFTYGSDYGDESVTPGGRTVRKGLDFSGRYQFAEWLFGNLNLNFAIPRALDVPKGQELPAYSAHFYQYG